MLLEGSLGDIWFSGCHRQMTLDVQLKGSLGGINLEDVVVTIEIYN